MRTFMSKGVAFAKRREAISKALRYNPLYYGRVARLLSDIKRMDREQRRVLVDHLTARTLRWARAAGASLPADAALEDWPILEKERLRGHEASLRHPRMFCVPAVTGGTTGVPLRLWRSLRCVAAEQAFIDQLLAGRGITIRTARIASLRGDTVKSPSDRRPPYGVRTTGGANLLLSSQHVCEDTVEWYADEISRFGADVLWVYPSSGESLARHVLQRGLKVRVPLVLSSSEVLHPAGRRTMAAAFGATVLDYYGMAERVVFASSARENEFWINPAYGRVELRPVDDGALANGLRHAEIIATGFWNDAMPLVRYRTGDLVAYPAAYDANDLEEVVLGLKPVIAIMGRDSGYVRSPRGEALMVLRLMDNLDGTGIERLQVVQESSDRVRILVVTESGLSDRGRRAIEENVRLVLPDDMTVTVEPVAALLRLPSGKVPYVIRPGTQPG